jgi:hypothetical protein
MSYETISLLLQWMEMGALLAILFRLSATFALIANTQRELRRAIHHLGEPRATDLAMTNEPEMASVSHRPIHVSVARA